MKMGGLRDFGKFCSSCCYGEEDDFHSVDSVGG
jgi:hypothetical protein